MKLGDIITFKRTPKRVKDHNGSATWVPVPHEPKAGVFVGYRTLNVGKVVWGGRDEATEFHRTGSVKAALVVTSLHKSPVYIPREDAVLPDQKCAACGGTGIVRGGAE